VDHKLCNNVWYLEDDLQIYLHLQIIICCVKIEANSTCWWSLWINDL